MKIVTSISSLNSQNNFVSSDKNLITATIQQTDIDIFVPNVHLGNEEVSRLSLKCLSCGSRFTYEIAPVFVLMEQLTLKKMKEIVGWPGGEGDGIFSPGLCGSCD